MAGKQWSTEVIEKLTSLYRAGHSSADIAVTLGRSLDAVNNKVKSLGLSGTKFARDEKPSEQISRDENGDAAEITWTTATPVRTVEDALAKAEVDTATWAVDRFVVNSWESAAKQADGSVVKTPLWQVKLWLSRKKGWSRQELIDELVERLREKANKGKTPKRKIGGVLAEVSIMDHHFGKLAWEPETQNNYDVNIARDRYNLAAKFLLQTAREQKPERILYVVGNDFYHVDTGANTTTGGTPQDCDGRWQKAFVYGLACVRDAINEAAEIAPVDVVVVPGNHDRERAFTLGVALGAIYDGNGRVEIDNSPALKKRYRWGQTLLGFVHGDKMPKRRLELLPNEMAHHWPEDFAATSWREWHLGHLHSESEDVWRFRSSETIGDVIVRRLPSLSGTDRWHYESGYRSLAAAELHLYDSATGRIGYRTVSQLALEQ